MRTIMVFSPQWMSLRAWMMFLRACSLSSGATASSTSRKTMSAADCAAFSNKAVLDPGTASSERCKRGVDGSMLVKLIVLPRDYAAKRMSSRRTETSGGAIDRHEERRAHFFAAFGTVGAQQVYLLAAHRIDGLQAPRQPSPKLREALGDACIAG